jgi:hypothetical protein
MYNSWNIGMITACIFSQNFWKKTTGSPSGPGAELAFISLIALPTSSGENGRVSSTFSLAETIALAGQKSTANEILKRGPAINHFVYKCFVYRFWYL